MVVSCTKKEEDLDLSEYVSESVADNDIYLRSLSAHNVDNSLRIIYCDEQTDVLGILSEQNIQVRTSSNGDFQIDATMMALNGSFGVENYNSGSPRGKLHVYGGITQNLRGAVGTSTVKTIRDHWGRVTTEVVPATGYSKDYSYDPKLSTNPPPYWPTTGKLVLRYFIDRGAVGGV